MSQTGHSPEQSSLTAVVETPRLRLLHLSLTDAPWINELLNEPAFIRNIGDKQVRSNAEAENYLTSGPIASYRRHGFGLNRVELKESGEPIGMCGLLQRDYLPVPDIGFAYLERFWFKGYAMEAAQATMQHARAALHLGRIVAVTELDNEGSINVLRKVGFTFARLEKFPGDETDKRLFVSER